MERHTVGATLHILQLWILRFVSCTQERLGNGTRRLALFIDEFCLSATKIGSGGFIGKQTAPQNTLVFGGIELDVDTRKWAGSGLLRVIPNASEGLLRRIFQTCVVPGDSRPGASHGNKTPVWSDEWRGYVFLDNPCNGFVRTRVTHSDGVYADACGRGNNAAECLWRLVRADCRYRGIRFPASPCELHESGTHGA